MKTLDIIIPYYKTLEQTTRLMNILKPQLNERVKIIIVDDGCNEYELNKYEQDNIKIIRLYVNSGGASVPRNIGLDNSTADYVTFIDADDIVESDYVDTILAKIDSEDFDYCYFGWQSPYYTIRITDEPPDWNCCVWDCVYKRVTIGDERFNPELKIAEDYDFNKRVKKGKKANIDKILYYYNDTPNSLLKRNC